MLRLPTHDDSFILVGACQITVIEPDGASCRIFVVPGRWFDIPARAEDVVRLRAAWLRRSQTDNLDAVCVSLPAEYDSEYVWLD